MDASIELAKLKDWLRELDAEESNLWAEYNASVHADHFAILCQIDDVVGRKTEVLKQIRHLGGLINLEMFS